MLSLNVLLLLLLKSVKIDDDVALLRVVKAMSCVDPKMTPI